MKFSTEVISKASQAELYLILNVLTTVLLLVFCTRYIATSEKAHGPMTHAMTASTVLFPSTPRLANTAEQREIGSEISRMADFEHKEGHLQSGWVLNPYNGFCPQAKNGHSARKIKPGKVIYGPRLEFVPESQYGQYHFSGWVNTPTEFSGGLVIAQVLLPAYKTLDLKTYSIPSTQDNWQEMDFSIDLGMIRKKHKIGQDVTLSVMVSIRNEDAEHPMLLDDLAIVTTDFLKI